MKKTTLTFQEPGFAAVSTFTMLHVVAEVMLTSTVSFTLTVTGELVKSSKAPLAILKGFASAIVSDIEPAGSQWGWLLQFLWTWFLV
jgi:hypothetical protein